jgi:hypothetical protein
VKEKGKEKEEINKPWTHLGRPRHPFIPFVSKTISKIVVM